MNQVAERSADELRRLLIQARREVVALNAEFHRLDDVRRTAAPDVADRLLRDLDAVAARHYAATHALDDLTDALIRQNRAQSIRATKRAERRRFSWRTVTH